jgi:hypothetical protein
MQGQIHRLQGGSQEIFRSGSTLQFDAGSSVLDAVGRLERHVDVTITSAQLLALNATPRALVAAPGAGFFNVFERAILHKPAGTAYAGIAAGEDLSIKYTDGAGLEVSQIETTGFLDQTTAQTRFARAHAAASANNSITPVENAALVLQLLVGEITTGDSNLLLRVYFRVVPFTLS